MNLNLMVVKNLLKKTHIKTDTALSGKEAVRMCEENPYDVILLDQCMPEMDGTQTLAAIRAIGNKNNAHTPVICLTADAIRGARERYMAEGFTDYLTKPVEGPELERMLLEYLPEEKITKKDEIKDDPATDDPAFDELKKAGFDTASGIRFCNSDPEFYKEVLGEFALEHDSKSKKLNDFYDNNNWEEYSILIHSVKSAAKTIGADKLSGMAARLEAASKEKDVEILHEKHGETMRMYDAISEIIIKSTGVSADIGAEEDVLEFAPE